MDTRRRMPCCYYPTGIVMVDDEERYLESLEFQLGESFVCRTFSDPKKALGFLADDYRADFFINRCILHPEEELIGHRGIDVDISSIFREIYHAARFEQFSVLVVDQVMPSMSGLEVCEQLSDNPIKKILLTGKADDRDVIAAFNNGVIHKYIEKNAENLGEVLENAIKELQMEYFDGLSQIILNSFTKNVEHHPLSCWTDQNFQALFFKYWDSGEFVEYYLFDTSGSILFISSSGKPTCLVIRTADDMQTVAQLAEMSDEGVSDDIQAIINNNEKLLFVDSKKTFPNPVALNDYLYPAAKLDDQGRYYYAVLKDLPVLDHSLAILCYDEFMNQQV